MKNIILFFGVVLVVLLASLLIAYNSYKESESKGQTFQDLLAERISIYKEGLIPQIDFTSLAPVPWDRVYVFGPYSQPAEINSALQGIWLGSWLTGIHTNDGHSLLLFTYRGTVIQHTMFPRNIADFSHVHNPNGYLAEEAKFELDKFNQIVQFNDGSE